MLKICFELIEGNTGMKRKEKNIYKIFKFLHCSNAVKK